VEQLRMLDPPSYVDLLGLQSRTTVVITDSGGIQEETTYLGVPCLTLRENTERPVTVTLGTNVLVGRDPTNSAPNSPESSPARQRREPALLFGTVTRAHESPPYSLTSSPELFL